MSKAALIESISSISDCTKKEAERMVNLFMRGVEDQLEKNGEVVLVGWGKFELKQKAEKKGRNPQTGEDLIIPARKSVSFKPGKALADKFK
jgi:DNA-binding protein HU-beta